VETTKNATKKLAKNLNLAQYKKIFLYNKLSIKNKSLNLTEKNREEL